MNESVCGTFLIKKNILLYDRYRYFLLKTRFLNSITFSKKNRFLNPIFKKPAGNITAAQESFENNSSALI